MTQLNDAGRIYREFDSAFSHVAAYVVSRDGFKLATVAIKRAKSGLRTVAYVHWIGTPMCKGIANGGGYDKESASVASAARKIGFSDVATDERSGDMFRAFKAAAELDGGKRWDDAVRDAGFTVWQAV